MKELNSVNPFYAIGCLYTPWKRKKTRDFLMFSWVTKETSGMKWVNLFRAELPFTSVLSRRGVFKTPTSNFNGELYNRQQLKPFNDCYKAVHLRCLWKSSISHCSIFLQQMYNIFSIWVKVFKNEPSRICGRQSLKNLKGYGLTKADHITSNIFNAVFQKFYLVHPRILCPIINR